MFKINLKNQFVRGYIKAYNIYYIISIHAIADVYRIDILYAIHKNREYLIHIRL